MNHSSIPVCERLALIIAAWLLCIGAVPARATSFTVDSLTGDITPNEITQFVNSINTLKPATNDYNNVMADRSSGVVVEGIGRMYEATHNVAILNRLIYFCDVFMSHRDDQPLGEHRLMWTGAVEDVWPSELAASKYPGYAGSESCQVAGHIAYCAYLILESPTIWNLTVPDGNPNGYGTTYKERAEGYIKLLDAGMSSYYSKWFLNSSLKLIWPANSAWGAGSGGDTQGASVPWNQQMMFCKAYQYLAMCHDLLRDNPSFLATYKTVVNNFATGFVAAQKPRILNGHNVCDWGYAGTKEIPENIGHAQHDIVGLWEAYMSGYTGVTSAQMKVYADTAQYVINLGSTDSWGSNVEGGGNTAKALKTDFIFMGQWNRSLYTMIAQSNIDAGLINKGGEDCKNTGYILYMKHWIYTHR